MKLLSHLSRITTPGRKFIPQIDGLRFIAIIGVISFHVWAIGSFHLGRAGDTSNVVAACMNTGSIGVELFFAVSGFILALPFAKQHLAGSKTVRLRDYFVRRVTRIEPPYIIQLVVVFFLTALVLRWSPAQQHLYGEQGWLKYTTPHMLASLAYAHGLVYQKYPYPNIVLWSLEVEVQFYIIAPLLAFLFAIRNHWGRRVLILLLILAWPNLLTLFGLKILAGRVWLIGALPWFLVGFLLVEFYLAGWLDSAPKNFWWDSVFLLCGPAWVFFHYHAPPDFVPEMIALLLCVATFRGWVASWFMSNPWITTIGGMCYTIYMYHWLMISLLIRGTIHLQTGIFWLDLLVQFLVMTPLIIFACALLFAWAERPFMRKDWPARFWHFLRRPKIADARKNLKSPS